MHIFRYTKNFYYPTLVVFSSMLMLSACTATSRLSDLLSGDNKPTVLEDNNLLKLHLSEWEALKPRLTEIIKLESELKYLIDQVAAVENSPAMNMSLRQSSDTQFKDPSFSMSPVLEDMLDLSMEAGKTVGDNNDLTLKQSFEHKHKIKLLPSSKESSGIDNEIPSKSSASSVEENAENSSVKLGQAELISSSILTSSKFREAATNQMAQKFKTPIEDSLSKFRQAAVSEIIDVSNFDAQIKQAESSITQIKERNELSTKHTRQRALSSGVMLDECIAPNDVEVTGIAVHLVSYSTLDKAIRGWEILKQQFSEKLCDKRAAVQTVVVNKKTFFSVRVGPFPSVRDANLFCTKLTDNEQYCKVSVFEGVLLP